MKSIHKWLGIKGSYSDAAIDYYRNEKSTSLGHFRHLVNYKDEEDPQERIYKAAFLEFFLWFMSKDYLIELALSEEKPAKNCAPKKKEYSKAELYLQTVELLVYLPDLK